MQKIIKNDLLFKIPFYLVSLFPFFLITGPFLSDLVLSLTSLLFLSLSYKYRLKNYYKNKFFVFFGLFFIYLFVNSIINFENLSSLKSSIFYFRFGIFSLAVLFLLENDKNLIRNIFFCFVFVFSILILDGYLQYFTGKNILGYYAHTSRISSVFKDELILGSFLSRIYPIFFGVTIFFGTKNKIYIASIIFILSETLIFLSGERAAFLYLNLAAIYFLILAHNFKLLRLVTLSLSFLIIVIIMSIDNTSKKRMIDQTLKDFGLIENIQNQDNKKNIIDQDSKILNSTKEIINNKKQLYIFSEQHHVLFLTAIKIFKENPIFGIGIKNFRVFCYQEKFYISKYSCNSHPHNTYLQFLSELGIIGFTFLLIIFLLIIYFSFKHLVFKLKKKILFTDFQICLLSALLISVWPFVPNGNFFNNWLSCIIYFPVGILLWTLNNKKLDYK